jgi:tetratricopeptide (TPR) repeat protein
MREIPFAIALILSAQPAIALDRHEANDQCYYSPIPARRIASCTALIKLVNLDSDKMGAYHARSQASFQIGALDNAISDATEAIKLGPYYVPNYLVRADAYEKKGQDRLAAADRAQAVKTAAARIAGSPQYAYAYIHRAQAYRAIGDDARCLADARRAVKMAQADKQTVDVQLQEDAGDIFMRLDRKDEAVNAYSTAIALHPTSSMYVSRGWAYHLQGLAGHAIRDLTKAVEMNPGNAYAYGMRGKIFEDAGNRAFAITDYRKAVKLDPNYAAPREALARLGASP